VLEPLVDAFKIASGDNDFVALLERVARARKPVVISGGMAGLAELRRAVDVVRAAWDGEDHGLAVLHCVSAYPAPREELNLRAIPLLARELGCTVGYSDHALGIDAAVLAVAAGARIVEKHFTLDKSRDTFRDHQLSADPDDFAELVERVRAAEAVLGSPVKEVQPSERATAAAARRSLVAARDLEPGHKLDAGDLAWLRPAGGLRPGEEASLLGRELVRAVRAGERLSRSDVR
jgi:sialic acid synthase SpsE